MSKISREEMLAALSATFSCYRIWRWNDEFGAKEQAANKLVEDAIRDLILKVGEWQEGARKILPEDCYVCDGNKAADLITEIRDYGKGGR
jgi:hypothetical protein